MPTTDHVHDLEGLRVLGDDLEESDSPIVLLGVVLYKVGASALRARYEAYQEVRRILAGAAEPFATIVRSRSGRLQAGAAARAAAPRVPG